MRILFFAMLSLFFGSTSFAQSNYNYYRAQDKQELFFTDFNDNNQNHYVGNNANTYFGVSGGHYILQNKTQSNWWIKFITHRPDGKYKLPKLAIDQSKDFEIETSFSLREYRQKNNPFGLVIGSNWDDFKTIDKYYRFSLAPVGSIAVQRYYQGTFTALRDWKKSNSVRRSGYNTLTFRKVGNTAYYFINGQLIHQGRFQGFYGDNHGIAFAPGSTVEMDYFRISYLETADTTPPKISITYPNISRGLKPVEKNSQTTIIGRAIDDGSLLKVLVNGQEVKTDALGNFSKSVSLSPGTNSFAITAIDVNQNVATQSFVIERPASQQQPITRTDIAPMGNVQVGTYYALIIGNNSYGDPAITSLDKPINDAQRLYNVLTTKYTFDPQNITFLKDASYVEMIEAFDKLSNMVTSNDNLLVFYAGHGWWDEKRELGYWLPTDARKKSTAFWIPNSRISDYMSSIDTKHTLLVADACFSGSIFKTRAAFADAGQAINSLYRLPSRTAMTSGNLKEVPDKSVFLEYLVKRLEQNTAKYLSADQLFMSFRIAVMNNSATEPQFGTIQGAGDEGGEFIFVKR